jgi:glutaredoxin
MLVDDGVITKMFVEPEKEGDPFEVSDADTMLRYLDPKAPMPKDVVLIGREGCGHCARARKMLEEKGWAFDEIPASPRRLRATSGKATTPQIFIDGQYVGGCDELEKYLAKVS